MGNLPEFRPPMVGRDGQFAIRPPFPKSMGPKGRRWTFTMLCTGLHYYAVITYYRLVVATPKPGYHTLVFTSEYFRHYFTLFYAVMSIINRTAVFSAQPDHQKVMNDDRKDGDP